MRNRLSGVTGLAAAAIFLLVLAAACGGSAVAPQVQDPAAPQQPAAAAQPVAPEQMEAPAPKKAEGITIGAVSEPRATPAAAEAPTDAITRGGILKQVHRRSPLHFRLDVRSAIDETTSNAPLFNQILSLQHPDFLQVGPDLAHSWEASEDARTFTFKLTPNVVNHRGNPWTSLDAKFTLDLLTKETENRPPHDFVSVGGVSIIDSIDTPDATTLIVNLNQPDGLFLVNMGIQRISMYTEADYDETASLDDPIGTGPFYLQDHRVGEKLEFRKNQQYFKEDRPYLDGIDTFIIRDVAAKLAAFEAQRIDYIMMGSSHGMFPENIQPVADRHPDQITFYPGIHPVFRGIKGNYRMEGPWRDKRVRQAINLAINRDEICDALPNCIMGDFMPSPVYGNVTREDLAKRPGFAVSGPAKEAELAQAKQLMADAGYPDGFEVKALCRDIADYRDHVCPLAEFLLRDKLNIRLELDVQESGAWVEKQSNGDWMFEAGSAGSARVDHPFDWLDYAAFCGEDPVRNVIGYCNEGFDELLREIRVTTDQEKLKQLGNQAMDHLYEEMVYIPLFWPVRYPTYWNYVKNAPDEHFSGQYSQGRRLEHVWLDR